MSNDHGLATEPTDPDLGPSAPTRRGQEWILAAVVTGGMIGAAARYAAGLCWPDAAGAFPWTTFGINVLGSALLAVVVVLAADVWPDRPLVRPFLGTGVLGGFTTFSTFAVDTQKLLDGGHPGLAACYVLATLAACLAVTWAAARAARGVLLRSRPVRS